MDELTDEKVLELDKKTKVIPLTSDTIGKNIFKKNIELTKVFLKDILRLKEEINSIQFIDTKLEVENINNYKFITDLVLLVNDNLIVNIELCRDYYNNHKDRLFAYVCKLITYDIKKGEDVEKKMKHVKQIIFACKEKMVKRERRHYRFCEIDTKDVMTEKLEVYLHYLEKHNKKYYNNEEVNKEDLWFSLFVSNKLEEQNKILKELVNDKIRKEFIWSVYKMSNDSKMIIDFGAEEYNNYVIEKIKRDAQIAKTVGMEEGMQKGIEQTKKETVLELLEMNMPYEDISRVTKLSVEKIQEIEKNKCS